MGRKGNLPCHQLNHHSWKEYETKEKKTSACKVHDGAWREKRQEDCPMCYAKLTQLDCWAWNRWYFKVQSDIKSFPALEEQGVVNAEYPLPPGVLRGKGKDRDSQLILNTNCWLFPLWGTNSLPLSCCFPVVKIKDLTVLLRMQSSLAGLLCGLFCLFILPFLPSANLSRKVSYQVPVFQNESRISQFSL